MKEIADAIDPSMDEFVSLQDRQVILRQLGSRPLVHGYKFRGKISGSVSKMSRMPNGPGPRRDLS
jgi:hypothetical protein